MQSKTAPSTDTAGEGPPHLELPEYTGYLIRRAQQVHAALWQQEISSDVTSVQFGVLNLLALQPGIDQRTLGEHLQLDRSTIADIVARLQKRGYLQRIRDSADRRRNVLTLTGRGELALAELIPQAFSVNQILTSGLRAGDAQELRRLLVLLLDAPRVRDTVGDAAGEPQTGSIEPQTG